MEKIAIFSEYDYSQYPIPGSLNKHDEPIITPWPLDERLISSIWRNVYTGDEFIVRSIQFDRFGQINIWDHSRREDVIGNLGLWRSERFIIENWIRVNHLPYVFQLDWMIFHLNWLITEEERMSKEARHYEKEKERTGSCWRANANSHYRYASYYHERAMIVLRCAQEFAVNHSIPLGWQELNANKVGQLVLF